jgi:hypothetical protein
MPGAYRSGFSKKAAEYEGAHCAYPGFADSGKANAGPEYHQIGLASQLLD